ncbi:TolC family protein [Chitinophaga pendula]|uniref:TolC family protein n=1 Tax=Chitinophaga TaxID=79328 RepID=UPI0018DF6905|nr:MULTISPECIES: TolC family protein [Chitinophaga]UCJ06287.1 TolC family protein [Chitinophaga pendula]
MLRVIIFCSLILTVVSRVTAQVDTSFARKPLGYAEYLSLIAQHNLNYAAEQFNVNIAAANVEAAKVFSDPSVAFNYNNNEHWIKQLGYGIGGTLNYTLELGGKRRARIQLANNQLLLVQYQLQDYFQRLRAEATLAYLEAIKQQRLLYVNMDSYNTMRRLAVADSVRFRLGAIMASDARQSKLEAGVMLNDVYAGAAELKGALVSLQLLLGSTVRDTFYMPVGDPRGFDREYGLEALITEGLNNRADLLAARQQQAVAQRALRVAKANRVIDLGLGAGFTSNAEATNEIAPTPAYKAYTAGISVPIKLSNRYKGELHAAKFGIAQSDIQYQQACVQVQTEVTAAYHKYLAARRQVAQFDSGLLTEAKQILDGKIYSYQRGETGLLEVLNAQRTYNDVRQNYYTTLNAYAGALVELERSAGIWDINF